MVKFIDKEDGIFAVTRESKETIGCMTIEPVNANVVSINHTFVEPDYRGQKIAEQLFEHMMEKLEKENKKAIPVCSYAIKQFERHPELASHLAKM